MLDLIKMYLMTLIWSRNEIQISSKNNAIALNIVFDKSDLNNRPILQILRGCLVILQYKWNGG